jgi:hypothetical protein
MDHTLSWLYCSAAWMLVGKVWLGSNSCTSSVVAVKPRHFVTFLASLASGGRSLPASQLKSSRLQRKQIGRHGSRCFPIDAGLRQLM